jgi:hypothetical protein
MCDKKSDSATQRIHSFYFMENFPNFEIQDALNNGEEDRKDKCCPPA